MNPTSKSLFGTEILSADLFHLVTVYKASCLDFLHFWSASLMPQSFLHSE